MRITTAGAAEWERDRIVAREKKTVIG